MREGEGREKRRIWRGHTGTGHAPSPQRDPASRALHRGAGGPKPSAVYTENPTEGPPYGETEPPLPPAPGLELQPSRGGKPTCPHRRRGSGRSPQPRRRSPAEAGSEPPAPGQMPLPTGGGLLPPVITHPSIAEQDKARASGTDSRAGTGYGEAVRKWRPGLHGNRRTLPSARFRSPSLAATEHAPAAGACALRAAEAVASSCPGRASPAWGGKGGAAGRDRAFLTPYSALAAW